jgi:NADH-quinone oxidoreductase subunit J
MNVLFYIAAGVATFATLMVITRHNAVHALLWLVVSLLAAAAAMFALSAPLAAALEVIIYAGAIMVVFVFVLMMLNLGRRGVVQERRWLRPAMWIFPAALGLVLLGATAYALLSARSVPAGAVAVSPTQVGLALFGPYVLGVELASMLLLAGLMGAYHLTRGDSQEGDSHA